MLNQNQKDAMRELATALEHCKNEGVLLVCDNTLTHLVSYDDFERAGGWNTGEVDELGFTEVACDAKALKQCEGVTLECVLIKILDKWIFRND